MKTSQLTRLRRLLQLAYPVRIVCSAQEVRACCPDLEGVEVRGESISACYARLEVAKRAHLTQCMQAGLRVATPNSHLSVQLTCAKGRQVP